jgi:CheY-like chemotaxis protein
MSHWHRRHFTARLVPVSIHLASTFFILREASVGFAIHPLGSRQRIAEGLMKPKRTILCVDDNEQSLSHRKIMLETRGYRVASFARGEEAWQRFEQGGIDLVIADMAMPGLDGPQLIAKIKDISPHIPAILISSKVRIYDHDSKADVFLAKGMYAPVDLLERVRLLLIRKRGPKRMQQRTPQLSRQVGAA